MPFVAVSRLLGGLRTLRRPVPRPVALASPRRRWDVSLLARFGLNFRSRIRLGSHEPLSLPFACGAPMARRTHFFVAGHASRDVQTVTCETSSPHPGPCIRKVREGG